MPGRTHGTQGLCGPLSEINGQQQQSMSCEPNSYIYIGGLPKPETSAVSGAETKVAVMQTTPYGVGVGCEKAPCSTGVRLL